MKHCLFTAILLLCLTIKTVAQESGEHKLGSWYEITSSNRISNKLSVSASFTNWNYELPAKNVQLLLGIVGLNYHISNKVVAGIGYAIGDIDSSFDINNIPNTTENRFLEQLIFKHKSNNIAWSHRFRLEQRFLVLPDDDKLKHRLRYRFKGKLPISSSLFISVYDEIKFNLNAFDFNQNKAYAALGANINKKVNIELGYARHSFKTKSFNRLSLQINLKYDFRKKTS